MRLSKLKLSFIAALISASSFSSAAKDFLNVSYDPTRELYTEVNHQFGAYWKKNTPLKPQLKVQSSTTIKKMYF